MIRTKFLVEEYDRRSNKYDTSALIIYKENQR